MQVTLNKLTAVSYVSEIHIELDKETEEMFYILQTK